MQFLNQHGVGMQFDLFRTEYYLETGVVPRQERHSWLDTALLLDLDLSDISYTPTHTPSNFYKPNITRKHAFSAS